MGYAVNSERYCYSESFMISAKKKYHLKGGCNIRYLKGISIIFCIAPSTAKRKRPQGHFDNPRNFELSI